jgi:hypothetical protein
MNVNLERPKIKTTLFLRQKVTDWLDLVTRVFKLKSQTFFDDILKINVFGQIIANIYTIEFQKHDLPHMHLFVFFVVENKIVDVVAVDCIIFYEFPNLDVHHVLFNIILKTMVHSPCG